MVITTSDSTNTLVSLDHHHQGLKRPGAYSQNNALLSAHGYSIAYERTEIYLPADEDDFSDDGSFCCGPPQEQQPLYLPPQSTATIGIDESLRCIPQVMETCDTLLAQEPVQFTCDSTERVLYVGQGEVAHAEPGQCDVIMSDKATTCHILAIRSTSSSSTDDATAAVPLVSLTHLDAPTYDDCVRGMIQHHKEHHHRSSNHKSDCDSAEPIDLELHVLGGYDDDKGSSREITDWLFALLAKVAEQEKRAIRMTLETCAVSSMNDNGRGAPIGRGLALDLRTGGAYLAACDRDVAGPSLALRSVRLWSGCNHDGSDESPKLSTIHTERCDQLEVEPFPFAPFRELDRLLALPDHVLLRYTSTSPDCEEDDFCQNLRSTLEFLRDVPCRRVFGTGCNQSLKYQRASTTSNTWKLLAC